MIEALRDMQDKVKLKDITIRIASISELLMYEKLSSSEIIEILLRLKAFGIVGITNEKPKLDNIHVQPFFYQDDFVAAYEGQCEIFEKNKNLFDKKF